MKMNFILLIYIILLIQPSLYHMKFTSLNPLIDVGEDIYCQHDEKNDTIFQIKKSGDIYTKVYKIIIPIFTASKMWLKNGTLVDYPYSPQVGAAGATNKDNYIPVKEGEQYFFRIFGLNYYNSVPVLFLDEKDNYIKDYFAGLYTESKKGVEITVPFGAKKMHITNINFQSLTVQKVLYLTDNEIDKLCLDEKIILEKINNSYMEYTKNPVVYKKIKKPYITFAMNIIDTINEEIINLFIEKDIPISLSLSAGLLIDNGSSQTKTHLEIIKNLISIGKGEVLSCNSAGVITEENIGNYNHMYKTFIKPKQMFNFYGIEVNGIILVGGEGNLSFNKTQEKWASSFYAYSDLYGLSPKYRKICIDSVYYHPREILFLNNDIEKMKELIDKAINEKSYKIFCFNSPSSPGNLSQFLDYAKLKEKEGKLEIGIYKEFYEKNAIRMNDLIKEKHTYYVSSNGNSEEGLSEKDPMNYETLNSKSFISGDTILLKRGDSFYGGLLINQDIVDDSILTLSSYGDKNKGKPILSAYKIVNKNESWEKEADNIYRIDLTNISKFSGVKDINPYINTIGFMETKNKTKYYNLKYKLSELNETYDFYCDGTNLFVRTNGSNPYEELGELKLATRILVLFTNSNMKIDGLHIQGTGAHGIVGVENSFENIEIVNNILEDIGGSFLNDLNIRYGNGIEFWNSNVKNLKIHKNIIRNVYDVAFTIQGGKGSGKNVTLTKNIFCLNSQDSEITESEQATGVYKYVFEENISFLQGRGWGYLARKDKYCAGHILFWGYCFNNVIQQTDIYFKNNYVYNPKRIYFITEQLNTSDFFQKEESIKSDYNHYYMSNDSFIFWDWYNYETRNNFILDYNKDKHSEFILLDKIDQTLVKKITYSLDYKELGKVFFNDIDNEEEEEDDSHTLLIVILIILVIILSLFVGICIFKHIRNKNNIESVEKLMEFPNE